MSDLRSDPQPIKRSLRHKKFSKWLLKFRKSELWHLTVLYNARGGPKRLNRIGAKRGALAGSPPKPKAKDGRAIQHESEPLLRFFPIDKLVKKCRKFNSFSLQSHGRYTLLGTSLINLKFQTSLIYLFENFVKIVFKIIHVIR